MRKVAVIPARGGSKRIPHKNIKPFHGKPIIEYSINVAKESDLFDAVIVSTEDEEIAAMARELGAQVPFLRNPEAAGDKSSLAEVMIDVIDSFGERGIQFDYYCCIFATAPFITAERLSEAFSVMIDGNFDSVLPLAPYSVPIQQAFRVDQDDKKAEMFFKDQYGIMTQDYTPSYYDAGQFYWMRPESVKAHKRISCDNTGSIILSELEVQDIDTEEDWKLAEFKYSFFLGNKSFPFNQM